MVIVGLGGMGGVQLLVVMMVGGVVIGIDVDCMCIEKCIEIKYCDMVVESVDDVIMLVEDVKRLGKVFFIGLVGNVVKIFFEMIE